MKYKLTAIVIAICFTVSGLAQNVGIGTSNPTSKLEVVSGTAITELNIANTNGFGAAGINLLSDYGSATQWRPGYVQSTDAGGFTGELNFYTNGSGSGNLYGNVLGLKIRNGNVGIATQDPHAPLHFANTLTNRKIVLWETANNDHQFHGFGVNGSTLRYQTDAVNADHVFYAGIDANSSRELLRIKGNGNVGIDNNNPHAPLQFGNNLVNRKIVMWETADNDHQFSGFGANGNVVRYQSDNVNCDHIFYSAINANSSKELMRIKGNGNVGIGTLPSAARLSISTTDLELTGLAANGIFRVNAGILNYNTGNDLNIASLGFLSGNGNNSSLGIRAYRNSGGGGWEKSSIILENDVDNVQRAGGSFITLAGSGNIGIGTTDPVAKLDVNGFSKLGEAAPAIKMKYVTGAMPATQGASLTVPLGVDASKIISANILVETFITVPPHYTDLPGLDYHFYILSGSMEIQMTLLNSAGLVSAPYKILVIYIE